MPTRDLTFYDVIIVGAGPVGLFLACELRLADATVLVLEQAEHPDTPLKTLPLGLRGLSVPTVEGLDRRGLLVELQARARRAESPGAPHWMQQKRSPGGHFAGIPFFLDQIDPEQWPYRLPRPVGSIAADMASIEAVLAQRATMSGVTIRRGCRFEAFEDTNEGVRVHASGDTFEGRWLVGCDGGRSAVRKAAGIDFNGTDPEFTGYSAQIVLAEPDMLKPGRHYTPSGMYTYAPPGTIAMVNFDGGAFHRIKPTRDHIEAVLRKVSGIDVSVTALEIATTWTDRARQATAYRRGRILLAGDAAHVHSPLGGQGLNLGLGDAMNLGWKLAATIRGNAPDDLLDTYASERQPIGAQILDWSRAQVALMRPSASSRALEAIIRDLIATGDGATYFAERVWGIGLRYELGGLHPLVGRSAPDFELSDGSRVNQHLRTGRGLLLDFRARAPLQALSERWAERIVYVRATTHESLGAEAMLIRPDGVIAWVGVGSPAIDEVREAATRWFGRSESFKGPENSL